MGKVWIEKEIYLTAKNGVGCLSRWTGTLAEGRVNVWALCAWTEGSDAKFAFVTENNTRALELLKNAGYATEEQDVVAVTLEDKPGVLWEISKKLADAGVEGKYMYVSTCGPECGCTTTRAIINTTNNKKAVEVLGK